ncbi:MAG: hypothetical protein ISR85_06130 [Kiritimatiellales bacterium]|nr:hypothetical protein [Kiritimatiellota bacterium]MBL7012487.1 hypothetical protein [Kiritimatiellales bacterium]
MNSVSSWMVWGLIGLFVITACRMIFFQSLETAVAFSAMDDGLYYPRLAQNIIERGICTYDGVTVTNGFHPLWLVCLLPVYWLIHNPFAALWGVYAVIFIVQFASLWMFSRIARVLGMTAAGWAAAVFILLVNIRSLTIFFSFLESPLVLLMLVAYLAFCLRTGNDRFSNPWKSLVGGFLIGLCFLARLDCFLLPVSFGLIWLVQLIRQPLGWRTRFLSAATAAGGCLIFTVPYLISNWIQFGHVQTVSAWQKTVEVSPVGSWKIISSWSLHQFIPRVQHLLGLNRISPGLLLGLMFLIGVMGLLYVCTGARRHCVMRLVAAFPEFTLFALLHALFIILVAPMEAAASAWYWVPEILLVALVAGMTLPNLSLARLPLIPIAVLLVAVVQWAIYPALVQRKTMSFAKMEVARYLRENTPPDSRGAMFDSGIVSYFSQRDFLGINGLIGDFEHAQMMKDKEYSEAFDRCGVGYLVLDTPEDLLKQFESSLLYVSALRTKFENFNEPPKPFVVYGGSAGELERVWTVRYGGLR